MKKATILLLTLTMLAGCSTTSISNSGYKKKPSAKWNHSQTIEVDNELNELAVLGITPDFKRLKPDLAELLKTSLPIRVPSGSRILAIQSGTDYPDSKMLSSMSEYWDVSTLSGNRRNYSQDNLNELLRYTAARGGNEFLIVYWGVIETAQKNLQTKSVSWLPLVGWSLPDKKTQMRVLIKFAVIDVRSGQWKTLQSTPAHSDFLSTIMNRNGKNRLAEIKIKEEVYSMAAKELFNRISK